MVRSALVSIAIVGIAACYPSPFAVRRGEPSARVTVVPRAGVQYLYVPGTSIPVSAIEAVYVQTTDGRRLALDAAGVQAVAGGRLSIAVPEGVTTGTVTLVTGGRQIAIPFHIAASMTGPVVGTLDVPLGASGCAAVAGTWVGTLSERQPDATATVYLEVLGDCRTVRGFTSWVGPRIGSVDSTVDGFWDMGARVLVARDTQLYNVRPNPGGGFCPTERYELALSPDGSLLTGLNVSTQPACAGRSQVVLRRIR